MSLRLADKNDLPRLHELMTDFHKHSEYQNLEYSYEKMSSFFNSTFYKKKEYLYVLSIDDKTDTVVGFLIGTLQELLFSKQKVATELAWWVDPEFRNFKRAVELLNAFEYWGSLVDGNIIVLAHLNDEKNKTLTKWYVRRGYSLYESTFAKGIK